MIGAVEPGSPAAAAGLLPGDEIVAIDGKAQETWEDAQTTVMLRPEQALRLRVRRGGQEQDVALRSGVTAKEKMGTIGVHPLVRVGEVLAGSAAEAAGLRSDDGVLSIDGRADPHLRRDPGVAPAGRRDETLSVRVLRGGAMVDIPVTPRDDGGVARIGIAPKRMVKQFALRERGGARPAGGRWTTSASPSAPCTGCSPRSSRRRR